MTTLSADGFESGSFGAQWTLTPAGGPKIGAVTPVYDGTQAAFFPGGETIALNGIAWPASNKLGAQIAILLRSSSTFQKLITFATSGGVAQVTLDWTTNASFVVFRINGVTVGSVPIAAVTNYILVQLFYDQSLATPKATVWLNGTQEPGLDVSGGAAAPHVIFGDSSSGNTVISYYDAVIVQDRTFGALSYTQPVSGSLVLTPSTSAFKRVAATLAAGLTLTPTLSPHRLYAKIIAGGAVFTPTLAATKLLVRTLTATWLCTPSLSLHRAVLANINQPFTLSLSYAAHYTRLFSVNEALAPTLGILRQYKRTLSIGLTGTPTLTTSKAKLVTIAGGIVLAPAITTGRVVGVQMTAGLTLAGSLARAVTHHVALVGQLFVTGQTIPGRLITILETLSFHDTIPAGPLLPIIRKALTVRTVRRILRVRGPSQH